MQIIDYLQYHSLYGSKETLEVHLGRGNLGRLGYHIEHYFWPEILLCLPSPHFPTPQADELRVCIAAGRLGVWGGGGGCDAGGIGGK